MERRRKRGIQLRAVVLALSFVVSGTMPGQTTPSNPLLFRLVLPRSTVCVGERQLDAESELRNVSEHPILLSPSGIRAQVSFVNRASSLEDGFRSNTISTDPVPGSKGEVVTLAPGESYRRTLKLELAPDFFAPGFYMVQVGYSGRYGAGGREGLFLGTLNSNEVLFEVGGCAASSTERH